MAETVVCMLSGLYAIAKRPRLCWCVFRRL